MSEEDTRFWIYAGGLPFELTEGDIVCVFSQYGEITEMTLSRDRDTGKSRGFGFIKYEDPRSCELAVSNFHGASIVGRRIKVSFANNSIALKTRKPATIAPHEGSSLPIVEDRKHLERLRRRHDLSPSASPSPSRRARSPDDDNNYNQHRSNRSNHRYPYDDARNKRHDSIDKQNYRTYDNLNYRQSDSRTNTKDRDFYERYRDSNRASVRNNHRDSSSHRRRDSRDRYYNPDRIDSDRGRHRRGDNNDRPLNRQHKEFDYHGYSGPKVQNSRRFDRRSRSRGRSNSRSLSPSRPQQLQGRSSPEGRRYYDDGDYNNNNHHSERRNRRHDSRDRKAYN